MAHLRLTVPLSLVLAGCIENVLAPPFSPPFDFDNPPPVSPRTWEDRIVQVLTPSVDVLWTIDNSCSMADEQAALADNFPSFMNYFLGSGLDYHVGVTSTDIDNSYNGAHGKLVVFDDVKFITPETPDPVNVFVGMASLGIGGSTTEKGVGGTYLALEENRETYNAGFYRDDAAMHTITITDEADFTPTEVVTQPEFVDWYSGLKEDDDSRTYSVICDFTDGGKYVAISKQIGGLQMDETSASWSILLDRLGLQAAGFEREYFLSHLPIEETIKVSVQVADGPLLNDFGPAFTDPDTGVLTGDWSYDSNRNSITFVEFVPPELATVIIDYTLAATVNGS